MQRTYRTLVLILALALLGLPGFAQVYAPPTPKVYAEQFIVPDALGDEDIADSSFAVQLPLLGFSVGNEPVGATTVPNATREDAIALCIEWASGENGTGYAAETEFWLPDWIESATEVQLLCRSTEAATSTSTAIDYDFLVHGAGTWDATAIDNATATLVQSATSGTLAVLGLPVDASETFTGGSLVRFRMWRSAGADTFRVYGARFRGNRGR